MRFLAEENFPLLAIAALRERGHDITSIVETTRGISDEEVAGICTRDQRVLLTFDKDFGEIVFRRGLQPVVRLFCCGSTRNQRKLPLSSHLSSTAKS